MHKGLKAGNVSNDQILSQTLQKNKIIKITKINNNNNETTKTKNS